MNSIITLDDSSETTLYVPKRDIISDHVHDVLVLRLRKLLDFYRKQFHGEPTFFVRVPGRINIIGEHVDYCGYPVVPMAISQSIVLAVGANDAEFKLELRNSEYDKYPDYSTNLNDFKINVPICSDKDWYNYYLCGIRGIFETIEATEIKRKGMHVALDGDIPPASGISSSSALVSAAVLATAYVQNVTLDCKTLANISAKCERYIGTQGGGMDQAIAYFAKKGCAQYIEFHPNLRVSAIELPENVRFVVANSLTEVNKAVTSTFNERTVECHLACNLIAHQHFLNQNREPDASNGKRNYMKNFKELQEALKCDLRYIESLIIDYIPNDIYTRLELCQIYQISDEQFENYFLTINTKHMRNFKLKARALHVIQESLRVEKFGNICRLSKNKDNGDGDGDQESITVNQLSELMHASHASLKNLYECSHPNLDRIVMLTEKFGIKGVRLTGAGWGGCVITLCPNTSLAERYINMLKEEYYQKLDPSIKEMYIKDDCHNVVFLTSPGDGAEILTLS